MKDDHQINRFSVKKHNAPSCDLVLIEKAFRTAFEAGEEYQAVMERGSPSKAIDLETA